MTADPFEEDDVSDVFPEKKPSGSDYVQNISERALGPWTLTILGNPRTKKTHNEIHLTVHKTKVRAWVQGLAASENPMRAVLSKVKVQPSKLWRQWAKKAPIIMQPELFVEIVEGKPKFKAIEYDLHVVATFYRERAIGDLLGYMQGLADLLQDRKVIANDRQLVCWDGSKMDKDKERPRVELMLHRVGEDDVPRETKGGEDALQESLSLD